ncbi:hypothetical protein DPMN_149687 [Dreissena polymorpha]|uniref:Uncharacterized protein n=1 Tax=Dreissena polymorpha TaxID=45954 RepID=A0A9D4FC83_DREPO|nr:hypothetical protein DPMN_149687 [Dreissena polymorpha]
MSRPFIALSLVAGVVSLTYIARFRSGTFANSGTLFALTFAGSCHMLACAYMLTISPNQDVVFCPTKNAIKHVTVRE